MSEVRTGECLGGPICGQTVELPWFQFYYVNGFKINDRVDASMALPYYGDQDILGFYNWEREDKVWRYDEVERIALAARRKEWRMNRKS